MDWIFNKMDLKWIRLEQKWIESRKLDFLPTPTSKQPLPWRTRITNLLFSQQKHTNMNVP